VDPRLRSARWRLRWDRQLSPEALRRLDLCGSGGCGLRRAGSARGGGRRCRRGRVPAEAHRRRSLGLRRHRGRERHLRDGAAGQSGEHHDRTPRTYPAASHGASLGGPTLAVKSPLFVRRGGATRLALIIA
jgi:hypothetical protein